VAGSDLRYPLSQGRINTATLQNSIQHKRHTQTSPILARGCRLACSTITGNHRASAHQLSTPQQLGRQASSTTFAQQCLTCPQIGQAGHAEDALSRKRLRADHCCSPCQPAGSSNLPELCATTPQLRNQDTCPSPCDEHDPHMTVWQARQPAQQLRVDG
jgi:hypothetical protein